MNNKHYTSIDEVLKIPTFESVSISRDGKLAAYAKKTPDFSANEYCSHVWIYETDGQKHYPITSGKCESFDPKWSPAKDYLACIMETGSKENSCRQIFLKTFDELNGIQITCSKQSIQSFSWSSDGKSIFYTVTEDDCEEIKKRKEVYGEFEYFNKEYKNDFLCCIELDKAIEAAKQRNSCSKETKEEPHDPSAVLTDPKAFSVRSFSLSQDLKKAVLMCTPTSDINDSDTSLYILDLNDKKYNELDIAGCFLPNVAFSPDGNKIAFSRLPNDLEYYKWNVEDNFIFQIYDLEKKETVMTLSEIDRTVSVIKWTNNGILVNWQDKANYRIGMVSQTGDLHPIYNNDISYIMCADTDNSGKHIAYMNIEQGKVPEIYIDGLKVTNESALYENKVLSIKELVQWTDSDGIEIEGILSKPHDFVSGKKYPLLVVIHGGPTWASFPFHNMNRLYPIEQFVENGYIVLEPNYRGSSGYGSVFQTAIFKILGIGDYDDVISGVDMLIEKGIADSKKIGVMGWSQGGYISAFCTTFSKRFMAVSVGAGISNWGTYYYNTDITTFTRSYLGANPVDDPDIYARTSPVTYIKNACTPTLIQHGDNDNRVPTPNAHELYHSLQDVGVESELVIFKGMAHSPQKPGLHKTIMQQNLDWFTSHVK